MAAREKLIGTWKLVSWEISYSPDGAVTCPFGQNPEGILIYSPDGYMSANISQADRSRFNSASVRKASEVEKCMAFESNFSYAGPFKIEEDHVIHRVDHALNPMMVGTIQRRHMEFVDRSLILSAEETLGEKNRRHRLHWVKAEPNHD
tara:strand:- start:622 stop:1065 length:444 start_codon:yes stop_codon:yes gene_type:complete